MEIKTVGDLKRFIAGFRDDLPVCVITDFVAEKVKAEVDDLREFRYIAGPDGSLEGVEEVEPPQESFIISPSIPLEELARRTGRAMREALKRG